jgi:hypothetical protein
MNERQEYIVEQLGANNWQEIVGRLGGLSSVELVKAELDYMFPSDDNAELARAIFEEVNA